MQHVIVDGRNVARSRWPNVHERDLVDACADWALRTDVQVAVVFDGVYDGAGPGSWEYDAQTVVVATAGQVADDVIAAEAVQLADAGISVHVVTSDRGLRGRLPDACTVTGGGSFLRELGLE